MKRGRNQRRRPGTNINRAMDSNGPEVRIRGTANQIYDKYLSLARDASSAGDRVKAENYFQHAEHYFRLIRAAQGNAAQSSQNANSDQDQTDGESASDNGEERGQNTRNNGRGQRRGRNNPRRNTQQFDDAENQTSDDTETVVWFRCTRNAERRPK